MDRLSCIILNYNDYETTLNLINLIRNYACFEMIVVVDNNSSDNSFSELKKLEEKKIVVIRTPQNGGYGYGNNYGIKYSREMGMQYALVANPDVEFSESAILHCIRILKEEKNVVAIAPRVKGGQAFKISSPLLDITYSSLLLNKIFKARYYSKEYYMKESEYVFVDAVPGSLVLFDIEKFEEVGCYDENVFLYNEEVIIGKKFINAGYKTILLLNEEYLHKHGVTVNKSFKGSLKPYKIARKSQRYFLDRYLNANRMVLFIFDLLWPIQILELFVWKKVKSLIAR